MRINEEAELAVRLYAVLAADGKVALAHARTMAVRDAARLKSLSRSIGRIDTAYCNRELTNTEVDRNVRLNQAVTDILAAYGLKHSRNHDPRGYAVCIHFPDSSYNTIGGAETGWGI